MTTHTTNELDNDPLAAALANRLDYAVAERTGNEVVDREWLIGTAVLLAETARTWISDQRPEPCGRLRYGHGGPADEVCARPSGHEGPHRSCRCADTCGEARP